MILKPEGYRIGYTSKYQFRITLIYTLSSRYVTITPVIILTLSAVEGLNGFIKKLNIKDIARKRDSTYEYQGYRN